LRPASCRLLLTVALMITGALMARRRGYATESFPGFRAVLSRFVAALPGLLLAGVIFGGIRAGVFTAIESASIAVIYWVTAIVYRKLTVRTFVEACSGVVRTTGLIVFVIGAAASFGWLLAYLQVPSAAVEVLTGFTHDKNLLLLMMIAILLVLGTFMDLAPLIIICTPIFLPLAEAIGIDPVHFGVILPEGRARPDQTAHRFGAVRRHGDRENQRRRRTANHLAVLSRRARGPARRRIRSDPVAVAVVVAAGRSPAANPAGRSASLKSVSPDGGNTASTWGTLEIRAVLQPQGASRRSFPSGFVQARPLHGALFAPVPC
jgi:hypothetical protein